MNGRSDAEQLAFAIRENRVIYTSNTRDFYPLHTSILREGGTHPGMLAWSRSRGYSIGEQSRRILRVWNALSAEEMGGRVEFLGQWGEP